MSSKKRIEALEEKVDELEHRLAIEESKPAYYYHYPYWQVPTTTPWYTTYRHPNAGGNCTGGAI